ncbi:MAG: GNAT family N-acetyltransferase [Clostridium sp.]
MGNKIVKLSELDNSNLEEVNKIFEECFGHMFSGFTKDLDKLSKCFIESFIKDMVYVYLEEDKALGFISASSVSGRAIKINKKLFKETFGKARGSIFCWQIDKIMTKVIVKSENECYIDFLGVSKGARRKGIGQTLLNYIHKDNRYDKYILEVLSKNPNAKALYEKVGYKAIKHEKNIFMTLSRQGSSYVMEYNSPMGI